MMSRQRWMLLDSLALMALTAALIWPWFRLEYLDNWASIESTFISDARILNENWPHVGWQPHWYLGTRFDYIYPPALRYGTAALSRWMDISAARAYHVYTGVLYCLGIAAIYVFYRVAPGSRMWAWWAAIACAAVSPAYLFLQQVRLDASAWRLMPMRLGVLVRFGEGPHISALALLPLAFAAAWWGLRRGQPALLGGAALACALVVANNFYGATALAIFFPILVWAVWLAEKDRGVWWRAVAISALAYGLTAFWLTPSYLRVTMRNMRLVAQPGHAWSFALEIVVLAVFALVSWRLAWGRPERAWAVFLCGALARISLYVPGYQYLDFRTLGEPVRLIPEFDWVFLMAATAVCAALWKRHWAGKLVAAAMLLVVFQTGKGWIRRSYEYFPEDKNPQQRIEYRLTRWLHENLRDSRTLTTGSVRFWFNAWFTLTEVGGGSDQGTLNLNAAAAQYQVLAAKSAEDAILWMQAAGSDAIVVHDKSSEEVYHDYVHPEHFEGKLDTLFQDGKGNWVYRIPRRYPGLARIVNAAKLRAIQRNGDMLEGHLLAPYVAVVENESPRPAEWKRISMDRIRVQARLEPGEALLVQESYDPAWRATSGGRKLAVSKDAMDFMVIDPGPGDHEIEMEFTMPLENRVGWVVTAGSIGVLLFLMGRRRFR